jgi:glycosyltransferase involved in cell wall biosynthesis
MKLKAIISHEHRFIRTPDGRIWSKQISSNFWDRYLAIFERISVLARIEDINDLDGDWNLMNFQNVEFIPVTYYQGPLQFFLNFIKVYRDICSCYKSDHVFIFRVSSVIANLLAPILIIKKHPYGLEVVGDPWDTFSPGSVRHFLRPFFRVTSYYGLLYLIKNATGVAYVTQNSLQRRYPPPANAFTTNYSSVVLPDAAFRGAPRVYPLKRDNSVAFRLLAVGSLENYYKGPDTLIRAVEIAVSKGLNIELIWIGDGICRAEIEANLNKSAASGVIKFSGRIQSGEAVREAMDAADLFVLPSRTEGLPRAVVEAMARGLPVISTNIGGIPELLSPSDLIQPNDPDALFYKIREFIDDGLLLNNAAQRNFVKSKLYKEDALSFRRNQFYRYIACNTKSFIGKN